MAYHPEISVVLPVYNGARYIRQALESMTQQVGDYEIILSDDNSADETLSIIDQFKSCQIQVLTSRVRGGQFVNFNRALRVAKGEFVQFFSYDDLARPRFLASQAEILRRDQSVGLVYSSCNIIDDAGRPLGVADDDGTPLVIDFTTYLRISSRHAALPPSISSVMIRRSLLETVGLFDERFAVAGDLEFYNRVAEKANIGRNRSRLLDVRTHHDSVTLDSLTSLLYMEEEVEILRFYRRHLGDEGYRAMIAWRTRRRGADHAKYLLRTAAKGNLRKLVRGYKALSSVHSVPLCIWFASFGKLMPLGLRAG